MDAIIKNIKSKNDLTDCSIYVTRYPCNECAKLIIQSGIKHVTYGFRKYDENKRGKHLEEIASEMMFEATGVKVE